MKFQHTPLQNLQVNGAISGTVCNVMDLSGQETFGSKMKRFESMAVFRSRHLNPGCLPPL